MVEGFCDVVVTYVDVVASVVELSTTDVVGFVVVGFVVVGSVVVENDSMECVM